MDEGSVSATSLTAITQKVSILEKSVEGLAGQMQAERRHANELLDARMAAIVERMESISREISSKLSDLSARKGESHAEIGRRLDDQQGHIGRHCGELDELRAGQGRIEASIEGLGRESAALRNALEESRSTWRSYIIPVAVGLTMLVIGLAVGGSVSPTG